MTRKVLITGASSGIGKEIARELVARGDFPLLVARNERSLHHLREELGTGEVFTCDVTRQQEVENLTDQIIQRHQQVDVLINNAGFGRFGGALQIPLSDYQAMMETNYLGAVRMTLTLLPHMLERGGGRVVNIASVAGLSGSPNLAAYVASKFALVGFSESLHLEYAPVIQVGVLCPGPVQTPFFCDRDPSRLFPPLIARQLLDANTVARHALKLIDRPRMRVIPHSLSWAMRLRRWAPGLFLQLNRLLYGTWKKQDIEV
ncbi:oxidoreductase [Kroppenstedtia guangzhouensis]|uniref:Oxidoreductase n=1 Tax=Kroppenstedtia guangzhouensis TaxID=1274356 RepID=A0ABQ1G9H0_9BACL|nr:SDR family oxidoreductase [Kroppenstedtia guangzhouensis]GGA39344.1 oxidoreductase [Kroppenstedtia guangzhouensis]